MTRDVVLGFFAERLDAWQRRDPAKLAAGHATDGVVVSPFFGTRRGRDAIEDAYRSLFHTFPDWRITHADPIVDGNRVVQQFHVNATHTNEFFGLEGTGRPFEIAGARIFTFSESPMLIQKELRIYDFTGLLLHMGVLQARPR
jgi:predicted ester cyclase